MRKRTLTCRDCGYLFDPKDERALVHKIDDQKHMCPACCMMMLGRGAWAVHNGCNGVFTDSIYARRSEALKDLAEPHWNGSESAVVPVRVIVEPEDKHWYREWEEHHLTGE